MSDTNRYVKNMFMNKTNKQMAPKFLVLLNDVSFFLVLSLYHAPPPKSQNICRPPAS